MIGEQASQFLVFCPFIQSVHFPHKYVSETPTGQEGLTWVGSLITKHPGATQEPNSALQ